MLQNIPFVSSYPLESLRDFVKNKILPTALEREKTYCFPIEQYQKLHTLGYLQAVVPRQYGGEGLSTTDLTWVFREIGYGSAGMSISMAGNCLALVCISTASESSQVKEKVFKEVLEKFSLSSFCFTEPDTGSDVFRIKTRAKTIENGYLLSGKKCFVTNANFADHYVVIAKHEVLSNLPHVNSPETLSQSKKNGFSIFYIPRKSEGLQIGKPYRKMGLRDSNTSEIFLDQVFVPFEHRIGLEGEGMKIAFRSIQRSRIFLAATAYGLCKRAYDITQSYLEKRVLYGAPLLTQPSIRGKLMDLKTKLEASWLLTCLAAAQWDVGNESFEFSSMAKLFAGQTTVQMVGSCVELFGGWGCMEEYEIEKLYRDAKFFEILEGPTFVQHAILAKEILPHFSGSTLKVAA